MVITYFFLLYGHAQEFEHVLVWKLGHNGCLLQELDPLQITSSCLQLLHGYFRILAATGSPQCFVYITVLTRTYVIQQSAPKKTSFSTNIVNVNNECWHTVQLCKCCSYNWYSYCDTFSQVNLHCLFITWYTCRFVPINADVQSKRFKNHVSGENLVKGSLFQQIPFSWFLRLTGRILLQAAMFDSHTHSTNLARAIQYTVHLTTHAVK